MIGSQQTLADALRVYFHENGFGDDGGYAAAWVDFHLGPIPVPFPNTAARKRAVPFHDLHHLVTGYRTDITGEFEISAWELGSGCRDYIAAWQLNLGGMAGGFLSRPRRTWRAFLRGRQSRNFYGRRYDAELLSTSVAEARRSLGTDASLGPATALDVALYALAVLAGLVFGTVMMCLFMPLAIVTSPLLSYLKQRAPRAARAASAGVP